MLGRLLVDYSWELLGAIGGFWTVITAEIGSLGLSTWAGEAAVIILISTTARDSFYNSDTHSVRSRS